MDQEKYIPMPEYLELQNIIQIKLALLVEHCNVTKEREREIELETTTPVIQQNKSKDVILSIVNIHRFSQFISRFNISSLQINYDFNNLI